MLTGSNMRHGDTRRPLPRHFQLQLLPAQLTILSVLVAQLKSIGLARITASEIKLPRLKYKKYLPEVLYGCHHQMHRKNCFSNSIKLSTYSILRNPLGVSILVIVNPTESHMAFVCIQFVTALLVTIMLFFFGGGDLSGFYYFLYYTEEFSLYHCTVLYDCLWYRT